MRAVVARMAAAGVLVALVVGTSGAQAAAQAATGPKVSGAVTGELRKGDRVTFRVTVAEPTGYRQLQEVRVAMLLHDLVLAEFVYLQGPNSIAIRGGPLVDVGSSEVASGSFFGFSGLDVKTEARGRTFTVTAPATVRADVPPDVDFRFTATNQSGQSASVVRHLNVEEAGIGFGWGTLFLAILIALFAGAFVGNLFANRRQGPPKVSVYGVIQRRLQEDQRAAAP